MSLSLVFYAFLARMAVGTLCALLPLSAMRAAERHIRFQLVFCLVLFAGCAALYEMALGKLHPDWPRGMDAFLTTQGGLPGLLVIAGVLCLFANFFLGTFKRKTARLLILFAVIAGLGAVFGTARLGPLAVSPGALATLAFSGLLGGMVMGGINDSMVLGHFYLMIRGLPLEALKRSGMFVAIVLIARILAYVGVLLFWDGAIDVLWGSEMVWSAWRVAFGFVGPLTLLIMVKDTVRLKHTQAATGLLYVAVGFALMGELAATWLELSTGYPS